jgi:hypothetical protein
MLWLLVENDTAQEEHGDEHGDDAIEEAEG